MAHIDEFRAHVGLDDPMPGALSIGGTAVKADDLPLIEINMSNHPFFDDVPVKLTIPLPPKGRSLGIEVMECDYYLLPYISKSKADVSFYQKLPGDTCSNSWILSINDVKPHTAENAIYLLWGKQQC
eukprot:8286504-Ditylum_brightwellii.AAC.1